MKISGVDIRPGNIIEYEKGIWKVAKTQHTQPGKGGAFMQVEMKNLIDGRKTNVRFRSQDTVEKVRLDTKDFQYLYAEGDMYTLMDTETYEQPTLSREQIGEAAKYLKPNVEVTVEYYQDKPLKVTLPNVVELEITMTDPGVKGDTVSGGSKPAELETGATVNVPLFVERGEVVRVDTRSGEYLGRA